MNYIFKNGLFLFFRIIIVSIMSIIVTVSISVLATAAFTKTTGYKAFVYDDNNKLIDEYTYNYSDGDDKQIEEFESEGYKVNKSYFRTELKGKGYIINQTASQAISVIFLFVFIYNMLFKLGNSDLNLVRTGHKTEDKLKGFKIGIIAVIPAFVLFLIILICGLGVKPDMPIALFTLPNFYVYQILRCISGNVANAGDLNILQYILMFISVFIIPLISHLSYTLGYRDIFVIEKIIYKNNKGKR